MTMLPSSPFKGMEMELYFPFSHQGSQMGEETKAKFLRVQGCGLRRNQENFS